MVYFETPRGLIREAWFVLRYQGLVRLTLYFLRYSSYKIGFHRRIGSLPRPLAISIFIVFMNTFRFINKVLHKIYPNKYTDADPYKILWVNPSDIQFAWNNGSRCRGWVVDEDWENTYMPFMQRTIPKAIKQRYEEKASWEDTVLSDRMLDTHDFREYCDNIDKLYNNIRENGYQSQQQLLQHSPDVAWQGLHDAMHPLANEAAVDIGPNGEFIWHRFGRHRVAIAKILDINRVPVQVMRRHVQWQTVRNEIRRGSESPVGGYPKHPDLRDIINSR